MELLGSRDAKARRAAAQGLYSLGGSARPSGPALVAALEDPDKDVREDVIRALWVIDEE